MKMIQDIELINDLDTSVKDPEQRIFKSKVNIPNKNQIIALGKTLIYFSMYLYFGPFTTFYLSTLKQKMHILT